MRRPLLAALVAVSGCSGSDSAAALAVSPEAATGAAAAPAAAPRLEETAFVTGITGVRRAGSDEKLVEDPKGKSKKKVSNVFATLYRGEEVTITAIDGEWAQVRTSDEQVGYVNLSGLQRTADVTLGTVFEEAKVFRRPDLVAINTERTVEAGTLLYKLRDKDQFSEVNVGGSQTLWILSEKLSTESREVSAAKLLNKIRSMQKNNDAGVDQLIELAKGQLGGTRVLALLDGPAAPPPAAAAPPPEAETAE